MDECPEIDITVKSSRPCSIMRDSVVWRGVDGNVASRDLRAFERPLEDLANRGVRLFCLGVGEDPGVNSRSGGQESRDRVRDGNAPHLSVLRLPEGHIAFLAVLPAQLQQLADAGAGDQRESQKSLELRHPVTGLEQPTLLIR